MDRQHVKLPWVVLLAIFGLGVLWGKVNANDTTTCVLSQEIVGTIMRVQRRSPSTSQYRVQTQSNCTLLVTTTRFPEYVRDDVIAVTNNIEPLSKFDEEFAGYAGYLSRQGIDGTVRFADVSLVAQGDATFFTSADKVLRRRVVQVLSEPEASVIIAMTLGDRGMIPEDIIELFEQTGLSHILAISGLHLSIVAGLLVGLSRLFPLRSPARTVLVIAALWTYVALVAFPVSAQRAALFWTFLLLAFELRALVNFWTVLVLTAAGLISFHPQIILDVGFQLSFAAVSGIGLGLFLVRGISRHTRVYQALAVPVGAALATWPIISYHFGLVSPVTVGVNLLAMPAVPAMVVLSLLAAAVQTFVPIAGTVIGLGVHGLWRWVELVAGLGAGVPGAAFEYTTPLWVMVIWYAACVAVAVFVVKRQGRTWREVWA